MKILLLYTYNQGYLSSFFFELSKMLSEKGHQVTNFALKQHNGSLNKDNVEIIIKKRGGYQSNYYEIGKLIKNTKPDVVLSNFSYGNPALLFGKIFGIKKNIVWFHSLNEQMTPSWRNIFIKKWFLKLADTVFANSYLTAQELSSIYNVPQSKIDTIAFWSNISDHDQQEFYEKQMVNSNIVNIGCPGRMAEHKNHRVVIEALSQIKRDYPLGFHLYIAGDGAEREALMALCEQLNLMDVVSFCGHLSARDMVGFYKSMDVVVLPSLHEAFGLVFIEAISLGTPVIVSSSFGALTFIDCEAQILDTITFDPKSSPDLKNKLLPYLKNKGLTQNQFKTLYDQYFDKELIFGQLLSIFIEK